HASAPPRTAAMNNGAPAQSAATRDLASIAKTQKGDRRAFEQLVIAHQASLRQFCLLILRNEAEADDAAQDVCVKAYQKIKQFRGQGSVKSWLLGIAANHCKDMLRANKHAHLLTGDANLAANAMERGANVREEEERIEHR